MHADACLPVCMHDHIGMPARMPVCVCSPTRIHAWRMHTSIQSAMGARAYAWVWCNTWGAKHSAGPASCARSGPRVRRSCPRWVCRRLARGERRRWQAPEAPPPLRGPNAPGLHGDGVTTLGVGRAWSKGCDVFWVSIAPTRFSSPAKCMAHVSCSWKETNWERLSQSSRRFLPC